MAGGGNYQITGELNDQHLAFIDSFLKSGNATKAALEAGYSESGAASTGWRLKNDPKIAARIAERREQAADDAGATAHRIAEGLLHEALNADHPSARVRAWELLAKNQGMLTERQKIEHSGLTFTLDMGQSLRDSDSEDSDSDTEI